MNIYSTNTHQAPEKLWSSSDGAALPVGRHNVVFDATGLINVVGVTLRELLG